MAQLAFVYSMAKPREGYREKLTITEPVQDPPVTIVKDGGGGAVKPKATGFPHRFFTKMKTIPLGVHFTGPEEEDEAQEKSRSAEASPEKEFPPWPRLLNKIARNNSMELKQSNKGRKKFPVMKRSASWAHFVEVSQADAPQHLDMEVPEQYVCDMSALFLGPRFASGSHSRVYQGVYNDLDVAVKLLRLDCCEDPARVERQFMQEVHCLSQLSHANIVRFVAASWKPPVCCLIMEYVPGGSLRAFLQKTSRLPMKTILSMARDVARGMEYLHSQGIVHRDLKSANLLLTEDLRVKVTDFGVGCMETECETPSDDAGTYRWMAPEMMANQKCSKKVDVYSFGIVLWELVTGQLPFQGMTPVQVAFAVVNKKLRPHVPDDCPAALRFLMEDCWLAIPERRPNFLQIVQTLEDLDKSWTQEPYHQQYAKSILFG